MITLHNSVVTQVSNDASGLLIVEPGTYVWPYLFWVKGYTNVPVVVDGLRDGSHITVDNYGWVSLTPAASMTGQVSLGFTIAFATVGVVLVIRRALRIARAAGAPD